MPCTAYIESYTWVHVRINLIAVLIRIVGVSLPSSRLDLTLLEFFRSLVLTSGVHDTIDNS